MLLRLDDEVRAIMEKRQGFTTPASIELPERKGFFVADQPDLKWKNTAARGQGLWNRYTGCHYDIQLWGLDHGIVWKDYEAEEKRSGGELKLLGRQYRHYMRMREKAVLELTHLLGYILPGIKNLLKGWKWNERER